MIVTGDDAQHTLELDVVSIELNFLERKCHVNITDSLLEMSVGTGSVNTFVCENQRVRETGGHDENFFVFVVELDRNFSWTRQCRFAANAQATFFAVTTSPQYM